MFSFYRIDINSFPAIFGHYLRDNRGEIEDYSSHESTEHINCDKFAYTLRFLLFITVLYGSVCRMVIGLFADIGILFHILTLLIPVRNFVKSLRIQNFDFQVDGIAGCKTETGKLGDWCIRVSESEVETILDTYKSMKRLASALTESIGLIMLFYIGETIPEHGLHLHTSVLSGVFLRSWVSIMFYTITALIFVCSSEICRQVLNWKDTKQFIIVLN